MIVDQAERDEALDPARSFIVQAPAGSGKTGLLVQRFLRLLSLVERPESVVAVTFTRKAAAELKQRVVEALTDAAGEAATKTSPYEQRTREFATAVLRQDQRYGWNLLLDSSQLQVQTIDSLCALLTRQMPIVSGFGGVASVVEDATELYRMAARDTIRDLAEGTAEDMELLARLGVYFDSDFASLEQQIAAMLAQRDQWQSPKGECEPEVEDFCALLTHSEAALLRVFEDKGAVDFNAITEAAIQVLGSPEQPSDLLYGLDFRIQHLLVDEFQDTSLSQYRLLNALTAQWSDGDGHTLFLVGDPMQSIYRFRGAEVSLFLRSWHEGGLESVRLERIALQTNFRCTPQILGWVQEHFAPVMAEDAGGGVQFRPSQAGRDAQGAVPELTALVDDNGAAEANLVSGLAKAARERGSVALLVRSRNHLVKILPALRDAGIAYEAIEIDKLSEQQHVDDIIALTRAILHTGDRVAWLACLRAPWSGLELNDLAAFAEGERERSIPELLSDPERIAAMSVEGRRRAVRAGEILLAAAEQAGRLPLRKLVEDAWLLLGGAAILQEPHQREDIETYLELIETLDEGGIIRDSTALSSRLELLFAKPATGEKFVQVMTIHKAKGLEFDTVILPQLGGRSKSIERELLLWNDEVEEDGSVTWSVAAQPRKGEKTAEYESINEVRKEKEEQELKRLFYVACTRAKNELYLIGNARSKKDGSDVQKPSGSFLRLVWDRVGVDFSAALRRSPEQQSLFAVEAAARRTVLRRLPAHWEAPKYARSVKWNPPFREMTASARKVSYEWVSDTARHAGTVVHELLKRAAGSGGNADAIETNLPLVESELLRLGVKNTDVPVAAERVMRAVRNTYLSERGRWILSAHAETRVEWPLGGTVDDRMISGTIDRMFRDEDGRLWIIDFKTSDHEGAGIERFLQEEQRRYQAQMDSYAALVAQFSAGPIWLGLYFPLLDSWREWEYETSAERVAG